MSCSKNLKDIFKEIGLDNAEASLMYDKAKARMLESKYIDNVATITTNTGATTQEAITKMLETDDEYQELLTELEAVEAGAEASIEKYAKAAENRKEKGGIGAAESAEANIEVLEERILDKEVLLVRLAAKRSKEPNASTQSQLGAEIAFQKGKLRDLQTWLKESKNKKKSSKARATRADNLKEERNKALDAKNEVKELITEYENNFTTGGQLLARLRTNDRIVKTAASTANNFNLSDYFKAKATSTDIENMEARLAEGSLESEGTQSQRTANLKKAALIFKEVGKGLQTFVQGLNSPSAIHVGEAGSVEG